MKRFSAIQIWAVCAVAAALLGLCWAMWLFTHPLPVAPAPAYYLRDNAGHVALYAANGDGPLAVYPQLYTRLLPQADSLALQQGVPVQTEAELQRRLEDYGL